MDKLRVSVSVSVPDRKEAKNHGIHFFNPSSSSRHTVSGSTRCFTMSELLLFRARGQYVVFPAGEDDPLIAALRGLIRRMQRNWSSFSCPSSNSESFWAYQWKKYGTCSLPTFGTQHAYFKAALDLKDRVDLLQILEDEGIKPTGQYYSREKIIQAVRTATGYTPSVVCSDDKFGRNQLYEIHLCVDKSGSHFIECPVYFTPTCNSIVRFAPFDDDAAVGGIYLPS
ncbi:PREDICTED: extracellular ribonuclease LE-like [Nelumbo nucifera]|uniref:Extracellular ribonuclease LE-like n=1 Tax=Nelumbo nucifera TaxID=4432 RepID=A0A1U8B4P6_NELNU|nr:PREDICTED: extracellular ribonuclease LE-like [Nelumbo nucifera]